MTTKNNTTETNSSVSDYLDKISNEKRRKDCIALVDLIKSTTGLEPKMWGSSIIGFGNYHYKYESGSEGDAPLTGISSRANAITIYLTPYFEDKDDILQNLGKCKTGKGCLYIQKLEDIDTEVLKKMIIKSTEHLKQLYPSPAN